MKKYSLIFLSFVVGCLLLSSCTDEELANKGAGKATKVSLSFETPDVEQIVTKGVNGYTLIEDLYLFIFDSNGNIEGDGPLLYEINSANSSGTIASEIPTTTGDHYIFAVANPTNSSFAGIDNLSSISTKKDFLSKTATLKGDLLMSGNTIPMVGTVVGADADGLINISAGGSYKVQLERIIASVKFDVSCEAKGASFNLKSYTVVNVPQTATLWGDNVPENKNVWSGGTINTNNSKQTFEFYMFENKQQAKSSINSYEDREAKVDPTAVTDIEFKNASEYATYVILRGLYTGPATVAGSSTNVSAEVSYYVHLGDINKGNGNFETDRNIEYTYNVSITGVNKLVLEVEKTDPYDRGDGTISLIASTYNLDAHYEFFNITVPKGTDYSMENGAELEWVSFRIYDGQSENLMDALVPGKEGEWDRVMKYKKKDDNAYNEELITTKAELNKKLKTYFDAHPNAESVKLTCFVAENLLDDYRECLVFRTKTSQNGSTLLKDGFKFRQNYMRKFFNNKGSGYATEVLNETGRLKEYGSIKTGTSDEDGWSNMRKEVSLWPDRKEMNKFYAACMARNRDENGDGEITDDELKWYLPARDQYIGLWIGADPLKEARLYTSDTGSGGAQWHYMSNSSRNNEKWILWAEQGSSTGGHTYNGGENGSFQLRCIRNFGNNSQAKYYEKESANVIAMLLTGDGAYRNKQESGELGRSDGHMGTNNKVYRKFKVATDVIGKGGLTQNSQAPLADKNNSACSNYVEGALKQGYGKYEYKEKKWSSIEVGYFKKVGQGKGDFYLWKDGKMYSYDKPKGYSFDYVLVSVKEAYEDGGKWRLPNQRELALMYSAGYLDNLSKYGYILSRTFSSFNSKNGFMLNTGNNNLILAGGDYGGSVRCVRDVD